MIVTVIIVVAHYLTKCLNLMVTVPVITPHSASRHVLSQNCDDAEIAFSVEDHRFLKLMQAGISQENGVYYTMPLPFKVRWKHVVPDNRMMAMTRLSKLKNRC